MACLLPLPEVAVVEEEQKRKRDTNGETLAEHSRRVQAKKGKTSKPIHIELGVSAFYLFV